MYEQGVLEDFSWEEDANGDLIDPRARQWEEEFEALIKVERELASKTNQ